MIVNRNGVVLDKNQGRQEPAYRKPTLKQQAHIIALLNEHIKPTNDDGFVVYAKGWSDEAVAAAVGAPQSSVRHYRAELHGLLRSAKGDGLSHTPGAIRQRVNSAVARLERVEVCLQKLIGIHNSLCQRIGEEEYQFKAD